MIRATAFIPLLLLAAGPVPAAEPCDHPVYDYASESTYRQVGWADFKGTSRARSSRWNGTFAGRILTVIKLGEYGIDVEETAPGEWRARTRGVGPYATMDKLLSHVQANQRSEALLAHEQGHFDIAEAYARRLCRDLSAVEAVGASETEAGSRLHREVQVIFDRTGKEFNALQIRYDDETRHGVRRKDQQRWYRLIAKMLEDPDAIPSD